MNHTVQTVAADKWSTTQNNAANGNDANAAHATTADAEDLKVQGTFLVKLKRKLYNTAAIVADASNAQMVAAKASTAKTENVCVLY